MDIVKELNKDNELKNCDNGSLVHSVNMMVSKDGNYLVTDNSVEELLTINNEEIVGVIACSTELVIFTNASKIYRYNEKDKVLKEVNIEWNWEGGEVFGEYTYNVVNDLIIAISERNSPNKVPLKTMNLDNTFENQEQILNPVIPFCNIEGYEYANNGNTIYNGTYVFFIRFFKSSNVYTKWMRIGSPIIVYNEGKNNTILNFHNVTVLKTLNMYYSGNMKIEDFYSDNSEKNNRSLNLYLNIYDESEEYEYYQIGYIVSTVKNENKTIIELKKPIYERLFQVTNKHDSSYEESIDTITSTFFNLYNVKTMTNYNNRLYVANYDEQYDDVSKIDTSGIRVSFSYQDKNTTDNHHYDISSETRTVEEEVTDEPKASPISIVEDYYIEEESNYKSNISSKIATLEYNKKRDFNPNKTYKIIINIAGSAHKKYIISNCNVYNLITKDGERKYGLAVPIRDILIQDKSDNNEADYVRIEYTGSETEKPVLMSRKNETYVVFFKDRIKYTSYYDSVEGENCYKGIICSCSDLNNSTEDNTEYIYDTYTSDEIHKDNKWRMELGTLITINGSAQVFKSLSTAFNYEAPYFTISVFNIIDNRGILATVDYNNIKYKKYAITDNVYNLFIHYIRPDGTYTDGIRINNNKSYNLMAILIGYTEEDNPVYMSLSLTSTIQDVFDRIETDTTLQSYNYLSEEQRKNIHNIAYLYYNEEYRKCIPNKFLYICNMFPELIHDLDYIHPYINSKGEILFRPYYVDYDYLSNDKSQICAGYLEFSNIPVYPEYIGYFISYEETEPIFAGKGLGSNNADIISNSSYTSSSRTLYVFTQDYQNTSKCDFNYFKICNNIHYGYFDNNRINGIAFHTPSIFAMKNPIVRLVPFEYKELQAPSQELNGQTAHIKITCAISPVFKNSDHTADPSNWQSPYYSKGIYGLKPIVKLYNLTNDLYIKENKKLIILTNFQYYGKHCNKKFVNYNRESYRKFSNYDYYLFDDEFTSTRWANDDNGGSKEITCKFNEFSIITTNAGGVIYNDADPYPDSAITSNGKYYPPLPVKNWENTVRYQFKAHVASVAFRFVSRLPYFSRYLSEPLINRVVNFYDTDDAGNVNWSKNENNIEFKYENVDNLFKLHTSYVDFVDKEVINYDEESISNVKQGIYKQTIRRSDVISDESRENKWNTFRPDNYKIIAENKGDIINLQGIGTYLIVHCEHSMFVIDRDSTLTTKDKDVQMFMPDTFDANYRETFTSDKGFGGLQDFDSYICNEAGYIFFDKSKRKLYRFDERKLDDMSIGMSHIFDRYVEDDTIIRLGTDKENNRLIISFINKNNIFTVTYHLGLNKWISLHTWNGTKYFNTKIELYAISDNNKSTIYKLTTTEDKLDFKDLVIANDKFPFYNGLRDIMSDNGKCQSVVDVIFTKYPDVIKTLNYITYSMHNKNNNYSGDYLMIYTANDISLIHDINSEDNRNVYDYSKPYYEQGRFNYNYFRSIINYPFFSNPVDEITGNINLPDYDEIKEYNPFSSPLIKGNYIVVRFIITETTSEVGIKNIECFISKYRE